MIAAQPADLAYRQLYYYLQKLVDRAIGRILDALAASGMADNTIVVFTSDHGDMLGAHGGMQQKWCNVYDESVRVPLLVKGPGVAASTGGIEIATSHVDLIPTLMGLAGIDVERATAGVGKHHDEVHPLPGRDLSAVITGVATSDTLAAPIYFMTEDDVSRGVTQNNVLTGTHFDPVDAPCFIESTITTLPTGANGEAELWKLNHYYERLDDWNEAHGIAKNPFAAPAAEPVFELHNLTVDPEERTNRAGDATDALAAMQTVLDTERDAKRNLPAQRNPA
jgi:arylsulfatase A-like enzyme